MRPQPICLILALGIMAASPTFAEEDAEVRKALEIQYRNLAEAHDQKDFAAIADLKTEDFHAIFPDGRVGDVRTMQEYTRRFVEENRPPFGIRNTIRELAVSENRLIAVVVVFQQASRMREMAGKLRRVETSVVQRETWAKKPGGWKLKSVDSVRDQRRYVDGKRVDPTKPYAPDAPPFEPDSTGGAGS
jgi:ketosteroid isomerase-like protein